MHTNHIGCVSGQLCGFQFDKCRSRVFAGQNIPIIMISGTITSVRTMAICTRTLFINFWMCLSLQKPQKLLLKFVKSVEFSHHLTAMCFRFRWWGFCKRQPFLPNIQNEIYWDSLNFVDILTVSMVSWAILFLLDYFVKLSEISTV